MKNDDNNSKTHANVADGTSKRRGKTHSNPQCMDD